MLLPFLIFLTAFAIAITTIPPIIYLFKKQDIYDTPDDRKIHIEKKPSLAGFAIFLGFVLSLELWQPFRSEDNFYLYLIPYSAILCIGVLDDLFHLRALYKLIGQFPAILLLVFLAKVHFTSLHGVFGIETIPLFISAPISILTILVITNALNLIDGLDGLAGSISLIGCTVFGIWFFLMGEILCAFIAFSFVGAILGFLYYNWEPSKIFMGDTGALLLGLLLSTFTIQLIELNGQLPLSHTWKLESSIGFTIAVLIIPLSDTLRVFVARILKKQSPFKADNNHIHHLLTKELKLSHAQAVSGLAITNLFFIGIAIIGQQLGDNFLVFILLIFAVFLNIYLEIKVKQSASAFKHKKTSNK